jgi:hypothetical protein
LTGASLGLGREDLPEGGTRGRGADAIECGMRNAEFGMKNEKRKKIIADWGIKNGAKNLILYKSER